ncbi:uncharacterized protein PAC_04607 [Phialocephala subalpina]|uniref:BTB domain-containing protein n=1 Tax=Phialocephala subalpina TaxID=576137 RepID=A0A1L7WPM8_9HELO|nr:uncharacterized protein PAC_04607 [Phialocephala subalpina]
MAPEKRVGGESPLRKSANSTKKSKVTHKKGDPRPTFSAPGDVVTFYVTEDGEEQKFVIHREYVCHYSPVLKAAFNSNFIEGQTGEYRLDDITHGTFNLLVQWLYHQKVDLAHLKSGFNEKNDLAILTEEKLNLFQLWVLADKFSIPGLQNCVVDHIREGANLNDRDFLFPVKAYDYVYNNTAPDSPLRRLVVMLTGAYLDKGDIKSNADNFPRQMLTDLLLFTVEKAGDIDVGQSEIEDGCYVPLENK